jgi:hypothetical protein
VVLVALYLGRSRAPDVIPGRTEPPAPSTPPPGQPGSTSPNAVTPVTDAFRTRRSNVEVRTAGRVVRLLPDDRQGSPHERILVRVEGGPTVLVAHNLDLAPRVPVAVGDSIELKGSTSGIRRVGWCTGPTVIPRAATRRGGSGTGAGSISSGSIVSL